MCYDLNSSCGISSITDAPFSVLEDDVVERLKSIESLITPLEAVGLYRLCGTLFRKAKVLEIGSYQGGSTTAIGQAVKEKNGSLYCMDVWSSYASQPDFFDYDPKLIANDLRILSNFISNTKPYSAYINMMRGSSQAFASMMNGQNFDLIFIDGAHDYRSVVFDIALSMSALKPGGILCGHDYFLDGERVQKAVDQLIGFNPTIKIKGLLHDTSIWCAVIDDPHYQYARAEVARCISEGKVAEAYQVAQTTYLTYRDEESLSQMVQTKMMIPKDTYCSRRG